MIFLTISNNFQFSDLSDCKLPFHQKDFIAINKDFGKPKRPPGLIHIKQVDYPGINIEVKKDAPALSIKSGTIEEINTSKFYGEFVIVNHGDGIKARYYHLKSIKLKIGDTVNKGDTIGVSSDYGLTTVNSIGLEIKLNSKRVNPNSILGQKCFTF